MKVQSVLPLDRARFLLITDSDLIFVISAYGMGKEGQECSGLSRACQLPVACQDGHPKDGPTLAKMFS